MNSMSSANSTKHRFARLLRLFVVVFFAHLAGLFVLWATTPRQRSMRPSLTWPVQQFQVFHLLFEFRWLWDIALLQFVALKFIYYSQALKPGVPLSSLFNNRT